MRSLSVFSSCLVGMLILSGCSGPSPMPRGYSSFDKVYKSVEGEDAPKIGYAYSVEKNRDMVHALGVAAQDLADKLDKKLSFNAEEVFLKMPESGSFYNTFDHLLRDALTQRGYLLSTDMENAVVVDLVTRDIQGTNCIESRNDDIAPIYVALAMDSVDGVAADYVGGIYTVPLYDFSFAGQSYVPMPLCALD